MSKAGYDFYLGKCLLPVTPQKLQLKINNANKTITLINEGEINILKTAKLTDIEFECDIPQIQYPYAVYKSGFKGAAYFLEYFESLKTSKAPFQFIVSRTLPNGKVLFSTNIKVSMEDYTLVEQASNGFDVTVKIKLKQWRNYGTKTVNIKVNTSKPNSTPTATKTEERPTETKSTTKKEYKAGDIVNFHGGTHYYSSYSGAKGYSAKAGKAKITLDKTCKGNGGAHPYHLIHTDSSSNVYGWVDEGTFD
jgi:hypothetical protein